MKRGKWEYGQLGLAASEASSSSDVEICGKRCHALFQLPKYRTSCWNNPKNPE